LIRFFVYVYWLFFHILILLQTWQFVKVRFQKGKKGTGGK
jgi:hypothetical protein